jgi:hypothetical protein
LAIFAGEREDLLFSNDLRVIACVYFTTILPIFHDFSRFLFKFLLM